MSIEPAALTLTGLIATGLSLIFAFAAHSTSRKRQRDRAQLKEALKDQQREILTPAPYADIQVQPARTVQDMQTVRMQPAMTATADRPPAPIPQFVPPTATAPSSPQARPAPARPAMAVAPVFKQYVTRPGTKSTTPVVENPPSDKDYVWE